MFKLLKHSNIFPKIGIAAKPLKLLSNVLDVLYHFGSSKRGIAT